MLTKRCVADRGKLVEPLRCSPSRSATVRTRHLTAFVEHLQRNDGTSGVSVREVFGIYKVGPGRWRRQGATSRSAA
jgi:hypothetical protein